MFDFKDFLEFNEKAQKIDKNINTIFSNLGIDTIIKGSEGSDLNDPKTLQAYTAICLCLTSSKMIEGILDAGVNNIDFKGLKERYEGITERLIKEYFPGWKKQISDL